MNDRFDNISNVVIPDDQSISVQLHEIGDSKFIHDVNEVKIRKSSSYLSYNKWKN